MLPTAILELNFGVVGDLFGRKRLLVLGGLVLALGELLNATSQNITMMWTGQALAGIGAAALFPSSLAVIAAATPDGKDRAKAVSAWALSISLASAVGPLSSGVLATVADFRWAFVPPVVLGLAVAVACWKLVTDSKAPEGRALDWPGQITIAVGLTALLWGIIEGGDRGWGSAAIVGSLALAAVALVGFVAAETRAASPMFNLDLLRIPSFAAAAVVALAGMFGFIGTAYCVSIRLGAVMHLSALRASMPFVILQLIPLLLAPVLSRMLTRVDARWLLMGGLLPMAAGQFWIAALPITTTSPRRLHRPGAAARHRLHLRRLLPDLGRRERRTDPHDRHGQRRHQPGPRVRPGPRSCRHQHHRDERRVLRPGGQAQRRGRRHGGRRGPAGRRQRGQRQRQGRRADRARPRHGHRRGDLRLRLPARRSGHPAAGAQEHRPSGGRRRR
ncbi:MFS transporter [Streptomyces mirabilis]|nr:MFS transporter [Streptomyces mirabilis]